MGYVRDALAALNYFAYFHYFSLRVAKLRDFALRSKPCHRLCHSHSHHRNINKLSIYVLYSLRTVFGKCRNVYLKPYINYLSNKPSKIKHYFPYNLLIYYTFYVYVFYSLFIIPLCTTLELTFSTKLS